MSEAKASAPQEGAGAPLPSAPGVAEALLMAGRLWLRLAPGTDPGEMHVALGPHRLPLRPAEAPPPAPPGLTPHRLGTPGPGPWHAAEIALTPGTTVQIVRGAHHLTLLTAAEPRLTLTAETADSLTLTAPAPLAATLHLDGQPLQPITLGPEPATLHLPAAARTGRPVLLELRDPTGTQPLFARWMLPPLFTSTPEHRPPEPLTPQTSRLQGLAAHVAAGATAEELARLSRALQLLQAGPQADLPQGALGFAPLPRNRKPEVSVVVVAHAETPEIRACLAGLMLAHCRTAFEVILIDDASPGAPPIEAIATGLTVIRTIARQYPLRAAAAGIAKARAPLIALIDTQIEPAPGWLDTLAAAFAEEGLAMAGPRVIGPDSRLAACGGLVWRGALPAAVGAGETPSDPRFAYMRQTEHLPGGALMLSRAAWEAAGGFDDTLAPGGLHTADLALRLRAAGRTIRVLPAATVFRHAPEAPVPQAVRTAFRRRWAAATAGRAPEGSAPGPAQDPGVLGRVLVIDHSTPRPHRDAARLATLRLIGEIGQKLTLLPADLQHAGAPTEALHAAGIETVAAPFHLSCADFLAARAAEFDLIWLARADLAVTLLPRIRALAPAARVVLEATELDFLARLRAALASGDETRLAEAEAARRSEIATAAACDLVLTGSEATAAILQAHGKGRIPCLPAPLVVDCPDGVPPRDARRGLCFAGDFTRHSDTAAADWLATQLLPRLQALGLGEGPRITLHGPGPHPHPGALHSGSASEDPARSLAPHLAFLAPDTAGPGLRARVLQAMAHGTPVVLSPAAAEGLALRPGHDALIASTPTEWTAALSRLLEDPALWHRLADNARSLAADQHSPDRGRRRLRAAFEALGLFHIRG